MATPQPTSNGPASWTRGDGPWPSLPGRLAASELEHARMNSHPAARERIEIDLERDLRVVNREAEHTADFALVVVLADRERRVARQVGQHASTFTVADGAEIDDVAVRAECGVVRAAHEPDLYGVPLCL